MMPGVAIRHHSYDSCTVDFHCCNINVTVTSTPSVVRKWLRTTMYVCRSNFRRLVVGLGVQWNPYPGEGYDVEADTLQLCAGARCLIFQLSHAPRVPQLLRRFLRDPNNTFVGIWNGSDMLMLATCRHHLDVHRLLDLRKYVRTDDGESLARASFERIVEVCLGYSGVSLDKDISTSEWDDNLSDDQIVQASVDAHVSFEIGKILRAWQF